MLLQSREQRILVVVLAPSVHHCQIFNFCAADVVSSQSHAHIRWCPVCSANFASDVAFCSEPAVRLGEVDQPCPPPLHRRRPHRPRRAAPRRHGRRRDVLEHRPEFLYGSGAVIWRFSLMILLHSYHTYGCALCMNYDTYNSMSEILPSFCFL
uniref:Uncharacterized protein n=1 Tax=Arundo donax TaxID=35708 RepID=A0A0A9GF72_ARUDO